MINLDFQKINSFLKRKIWHVLIHNRLNSPLSIKSQISLLDSNWCIHIAAEFVASVGIQTFSWTPTLHSKMMEYLPCNGFVIGHIFATVEVKSQQYCDSSVLQTIWEHHKFSSLSETETENREGGQDIQGGRTASGRSANPHKRRMWFLAIELKG